MLKKKDSNLRYAFENVIKIFSLERICVYMLTFIFYYHKSKLQFYNDFDNVSKLNVDMHINAFKRKRLLK